MSSLNWKNSLVVIRGGGDIASGIAHRLHTAGFKIVILEIENPTHIRRTVSFAQAVYDGEITIEEVTSVRIDDVGQVDQILSKNKIPVLIDREGTSLPVLGPVALVDGILAKTNLGTRPDMAPIVIGVGPGFTAGVDTHAVVETNRGHFLGKVIWEGPAQKDTGIPGTIGGISAERVIRSPAEGIMEPLRDIGEKVTKGEIVARVGDTAVAAPISGVVRGLMNRGIGVVKGDKIGDVDPRNDPTHCLYISDKSRAVGGGVLEALLHLLNAQ